jgi:hypothetical protein
MPSSDDDKKLKRLRPDIMVYGPMETLLIDVSLLHPQSPSYVREHKDDDARREQRIIQRREQQKRDKYRRLAKLHDHGRVVPFVVDAYGAFGVEAIDFVRTLATIAKGNGCFERGVDFCSMAIGRVAVAVQRGNSELITAAMTRIHTFFNGLRVTANIAPLGA